MLRWVPPMLAILAAQPLAAQADATPKRPWSDKAALSYVAVGRNAFTTTLSSRLALKVGYDVTYANKPAFVGVDVVQTPVTTPPVILGQVPFQVKKTDTVFTTSLVIAF